MGRKNRRKNKGNKKNRQYQQPLPPLDPDFKMMLFQEALEAISLLKQSKEQFIKKEVKTAFILSRVWLDTWKVHVGYDAVMKGDQPGGRKYGRQQMGEMNADLLGKEELFHEAKLEYLAPPFKDVAPVKDYILVNELTWNYFFTKYGGVPCVREAQDNGEFNLRQLKPNVMFIELDVIDEIQNVNQSQLTNNTDLLGLKKLQVMYDWTFTQFVDYLGLYLQGKIDVWLINPMLDINQVKVQLIKSIHSKTYSVIGDIINRQNEQLNQIIKNHFIILVSEQGVFNKLDYQFAVKGTGQCYQCGQKSTLNVQCPCHQVFYCSDHCRYKDQEFHSLECIKAYDSEDDEQFDNIQFEHLKEIGAGLVNFGNTCYMNASLQSLFSSEHFQLYLADKIYWIKGLSKRQIQLNYKIEKLLKLLLTNIKSINPYSFRQQIAKRHPIFGNNFQQDAAEFILYLFDALNEELFNQQKDQQEQEELGDIDMETTNKNDQQSESDSESDDADGDTEQVQQQQEQGDSAVIVKYKKKDMHINDFNLAYETIQKNNSQLLIQNFLGLLQSEIECPICQQTTKNYESFNILPLDLSITKKDYEELQIFIIYEDWYTPFAQYDFKYRPDTTLLMDLKREIGEELGILPTKLMGAMCHSNSVQTYLYYDEDSISKILKDNPNLYLCLFELQIEAQTVTDNDQYFDIQLFAFEKVSTYSVMCENNPISPPKLMIFPKSDTSLQIYEKIFSKLKDSSNQQELLQIIPQEQQEENIIDVYQLKQILKYQLLIEVKVPAKIKCPFTCQKVYKKEQKCHSCEFPLNNKITLNDYLDEIKYKNSHTTFSIVFDEKQTPQQLRSNLPVLQQQKQKEKSCNLEELIEKFQHKEQLQGENAYYCSICKDLTIAYKQIYLAVLPDQLIIQLKRFQFDEFRHQFNKNNILVTYPEQIQIQDKKYQLYGVVQHFGGLDNGHYVSFGLRKGNWYEFNDERVKELKIDEVLNNKHAYMLFYQKQQN